MRLQGVQLAMSYAYHPQIDGQTEVVSKSLEHYLRSFLSDRPIEWSELLYLAEYQFNTNFHIIATKLTPYVSLYGLAPPRLMDYIPSTTRVATVDYVEVQTAHSCFAKKKFGGCTGQNEATM